jgi:ribose 5-phosphate isomerase B
VEHDDVNLLCVGAQIIGIKLAEDILRAFLQAEFSTDPDFPAAGSKAARPGAVGGAAGFG